MNNIEVTNEFSAQDQLSNILRYCFERDYLIQKSLEYNSDKVKSLWVYVPLRNEYNVEQLNLMKLQDIMLENGFKFGVWANQSSVAFLTECDEGTSTKYTQYIFDKKR